MGRRLAAEADGAPTASPAARTAEAAGSAAAGSTARATTAASDPAAFPAPAALPRSPRPRHDALANRHPAVCLAFFAVVIGCTVVIQHPAYLAASLAGAVAYRLLLRGREGWGVFAGLVPVALLIAALNPVFNTAGDTVLFVYLGRRYTLEALCYGADLGAMFYAMMVWFACLGDVLTSDKLTSLFGRLAPALSLLLVMTLRAIPDVMRKAGRVVDARRSIGRGVAESGTAREKVAEGGAALSTLTDLALEGSMTTSDSMRARGYGAGRRTTFRPYRFTPRDAALLVATVALGASAAAAGGTGASFIPSLAVDPLTWGFAAYCALLLIPSLLHAEEAARWRISISRI